MAVVNLNNAELQKLMQDEPELLLLDVRTPQEYYGLGHIPGSRLLPIHELPGQLPSLNPAQKVVVICEHGIRSHDASQYLLYNGFQQVCQLTAGMAEWNGPRAFASE